MTSSTITGDRRWASARRGGMTVLGKVAVPKPINLPSQRLENHGVDPNVEIVPKGTLSWGSRPSSAGSNAWGTSPLSPTTDCSSSSPRHLVGHPLSIGDTRPSTAGSERAPDSNGNPWGTNSRPSSASGVLASNLASSSSLRPRSAETRPGSSHLSRFAESAPEGSGAWAAKTSPERKGVAFSANKGFSLSSGDFPTLGSEKDKSNMNLDPLDHASNGRPGSSGGVRTMPDGREISHNDDVSRNSDVKGNSWRNDGPPFMEDGPRPSMERWHREPRMYPNPNMAPHYESWRGASPVNPPGGGWYRGPPGPPPYGGGPVPPGGFHMEPFPYYHPQVPAPGLASSPPIPPAPGHHGHLPKNGDISHMPHVPHMHPGISMRPGFYPGPVHYDGFYRPPLGFCNPSERDLPFMGMPAGPPVYTIHGNQNGPDLNNAYPRSREGRGSEQVEPGHPHDPQGHYKGFGHPKDSWSKNEEQKWSHNREKGILSKPSLQENAWGDEYKNDEGIRYGKCETFEDASCSFVPINPSSAKFSEHLSNIIETQTSSSIENIASTRDHSLIQKIEGLNAKTRATGRKQEGFHKETPNDRVQTINPVDHQSANEANADVVPERHYPRGVHVPVSCCDDVSAVDKSQESAVASGTVPPRRSGRGAQYRGGSHARVGFHGQESDESEEKLGIQSVLETGSRSLTIHQVGEHNAALQAAEQSKTNVMGICDGESVVSSIDPSDMQRARMREIAKQRAIQLQKEEEERVREQKAKAFAKLEELNRRSANLGVENLHQSDPTPPPVDVPKKQGVSRNQSELSVDANHSFGSSSASSNNSPQIIERSDSKTVDFDVSSRPLVAETNRSAYHQDDSLSSQKQLPVADNSVDNAVSHRTGPQVREVVKQKQGGNKQRQSVPPEKISVLNAILTGSTDAEKDLKVVSASQEVTGSFVDPRVGKEQDEPPVTAELPVQKRKIHKSGKNRHRVEEPSVAVSSSVIQPKDSNLSQAIPETAEQNSSSLPVYSISMQLSADPKDSIHSSGNHSSSSREDTHGRTNSAWKALQSRKSRNLQGNWPAEKIHSNEAVWAPVQPHNKLEVADQISQKAAGPPVSSAGGDILAHYGSKTKRAEMERYVPKPVAKELAQQGSVQQTSSPSIDPAAVDVGNGREKASHGHEHVMKAGANVDGKNRHQRAQGSWRQRVSAELTSAQDSLDRSASTSKNIQTCNGSQSVRSDEFFVRGLPSKSEERLEKGPQTFISDGGDSVNDSSSNLLTGVNGVKDHIPSGRGKRHPFKGHKGSGSHEFLDHKDSNAGWTDLLCSHAEANQMDRNISSKDNRAAGDHSVPHWQPKFQGHVTHNQQRNMFRGSQNNIPEDKEALKNETGPSGGSRFSPLDMHSVAKDPLPVSENKGASEVMRSTGHQEAKRNRRVAPVKKRPDSSSQEPEALAGEVEHSSFGSMDGCNELHPSVYLKNANHSGSPNRGRDFRGDWSSTGQENKPRVSSANRERQRQNSHYEYQPVGPYNGSSRSNESGVRSESQSVASRFRDRGQNYSRRGRGNFHGRQSGNE